MSYCKDVMGDRCDNDCEHCPMNGVSDYEER